MNEKPPQRRIYPPSLVNGNRRFRRQKLRVRRAEDESTYTKSPVRKRVEQRLKRRNSR